MKQLVTLALVLVCAAGCAARPGATTPAAAEPSVSALDIKTKPERTDFQETSRYQEVVDFMDAVAKAVTEACGTQQHRSRLGHGRHLAEVQVVDRSRQA